jgi:hypothetical protein
MKIDHPNGKGRSLMIALKRPLTRIVTSEKIKVVAVRIEVMLITVTIAVGGVSSEAEVIVVDEAKQRREVEVAFIEAVIVEDAAGIDFTR